MHLSNALSVAENFYAEGICNIIADLLHVFLVDSLVFSSHAFPQLKPYLPLEFNALIQRELRISIIPCGIRLMPSLEVFRV